MLVFYDKNNHFEVLEKWQPGCWVSVETPTAEEQNYLISGLGVPDYFVEDIEDNDERPRREEEDGWYLTVMRVPLKKGTSPIDFMTAPLGIIAKGNDFITICNHKIQVIDDFIVYAMRKQITVQSTNELTMRLLLSSSVWFLKYLKQINVYTMKVEKELQEEVTNKQILELQRIESSLVYFITSLKGNDVLFYRLQHSKIFCLAVDEDLIEDTEIELKQAEETTSIYRNIIHSLSNSYSSVISNNINDTMKKLTGITLIFMLPTLIASIFGMNVPIYLDSNPYAIFIIVGASVLSGIALYFILKKFDIF